VSVSSSALDLEEQNKPNESISGSHLSKTGVWLDCPKERDFRIFVVAWLDEEQQSDNGGLFLALTAASTQSDPTIL